MRQFDICRLRQREGQRRPVELIVILQSHLFTDLDTRVTAPLVPMERLPPLHRLRPQFAVGRKQHRLIVDRLSVLSTRDIGAVVGSAIEHEYDIRRALEIVFMGV